MPASPRPIRIDPDRLALERLDLDPKDFQSPPTKQNYALIFEDEAIGLAVGIWEHTAGVSRDVEVDEIFVVLRGRATIEVADGTILQVGPGDVGVLEAGAQTTWTVHEDLRKIYIIRS